MKLSLVIPFVDTVDITIHCVETAAKNAGCEFELVLIDNGSDRDNAREVSESVLKNKLSPQLILIRNGKNIGVLPSFKQGFEKATGDIICFIHSDVLIHEENWVSKVINAFETVPNLGLAGIFGAIGVGDNGGRVRSQSKMLGLKWGACECHDVAWKHHSEYLDGVAPATILDGVGMFFSRDAANALVGTDMFDGWRAIHHFYDRIMPLKLIDKGFKVATIGLGFDHWSGATANSAEKYTDAGHEWLKSQNQYDESQPVDHQIYTIAEKQFFSEFGKRIPCYVHADWSYEWRGLV